MWNSNEPDPSPIEPWYGSGDPEGGLVTLANWAAHFWDGKCRKCGRERPVERSARAEAWFFGMDSKGDWAAECFACVPLEDMLGAWHDE